MLARSSIRQLSVSCNFGLLGIMVLVLINMGGCSDGNNSVQSLDTWYGSDWQFRQRITIRNVNDAMAVFSEAILIRAWNSVSDFSKLAIDG